MVAAAHGWRGDCTQLGKEEGPAVAAVSKGLARVKGPMPIQGPTGAGHQERSHQVQLCKGSGAGVAR